jgi:hypothetical protein
VSRSNSDNSEVLVPITQIAMRLGYPDEAVTNRVKASEVVADWDGVPAVPWSVAKSTLETLAAEKAAYEREQYAATNAQMDAEQHEREYPLRAYEDALSHNRIDGVRVSVPPADEEWMPE